MNSYFLKDFFNSLNNNNVKYCVLRNYQLLPESTGGSDLDILINKKDSKKFIEIVSKTSQNHGGDIISFIASDICPRICVLGKKGNGWGVMIDLHYDEISYRDYTILSNTTVWENTFEHNGIFALNTKSDALIGLFKELLNNRTCKEKYYTDFKNLALDEVFLNNVFNSVNKPEIVDVLLQCKESSYSEKELTRLVKALDFYFPKKRLARIKKISKFSRLFKQPGFTIAFLGTDGSGKSTIIENLNKPLYSAFHKAVYYEHMRPNKFPSISSLLSNKEESTGPVTNPHGSKPSGFLGSLIRWSYYLLDYTFGFYIKVWPKKAIRSCVWLFDRYYYDNLIDPKRGRINLPSWILKLGKLIIPEPDIILCLGANAEVIYKRKPELPFKEVERQVEELQKFCRTNKRATWIDTGKDINESISDSLEVIIRVMAKRFESVNFTSKV